MKRKRVCAVFALVILAVVAACAGDPPTGTPGSDDLAPNLAVSVATENGITLISGTSAADLSAARSAAIARGGRVVREMPGVNLLFVEGLSVNDGSAVAASSRVLVGRDRVLSMIPQPAAAFSGVRALSGPTSQGTDQSAAAFFPIQWNIRVTEADRAWAASNGGANELVCILDSGIDPHHLDLTGKVDLSRSFSAILVPRFASDVSLLDFNSHGTFVAGLVSTLGIGVASTAPDAKLCAIKVLSEDGSGSFGDILFAILEAAKMGADVINMSLTGIVDASTPGGAFLITLLERVIGEVRSMGSLVVAASGNNGLNFDDIPKRFVVLPAMAKGVISVGATAPVNQLKFDGMASYTNFGNVRTLDLVAPGGDFVAGGVLEDLVLSPCSQYQVTLPFSCAGGVSYIFGSGTSFAAPMVAGAGAVVESGAAGGRMNTADLERCLLTRTDRITPIWRFGNGRLNVFDAAGCNGP
jgi:subtilisin family serine protease